LAPSDPHICAIAADHAVTDTALPFFDLDDTGAIADFIADIVGLGQARLLTTCVAAGSKKRNRLACQGNRQGDGKRNGS
ncbi:hypothetical protein AB9F43_33170, partial [Rhizobium leguminosarum]